MSNKLYYSLPKKAQPTSKYYNSSNKYQNSIESKKIVNIMTINTTPEVSQFCIDKLDFTENSTKKYNEQNVLPHKMSDNLPSYTHNLKIDYEKLLQPKNIFDFQIAKDLKQMRKNTILNHQYTVSEFSGKMNTTEKSINNIKAKDNQLINSINKVQKVAKVEAVKKQNPESGLKPKKWPRNVKSYGYLNKTSKKQQKTPTKTKLEQSQRKSQKSLSSSRKISHSRIIKMANPTSGIQTRLVTFPDISDIIKSKQRSIRL